MAQMEFKDKDTTNSFSSRLVTSLTLARGPTILRMRTTILQMRTTMPTMPTTIILLSQTTTMYMVDDGRPVYS